ncbi:MAG: helix-turn-helix transcriptional regulator [Pleurocapsa sp. SU_196_0]|nr:helix-turn-helix transcriptional regulator [Pleurocapsa sp. SU_196_0]
MTSSEFGEFIRTACDVRGWTAHKLSKEAGVNYETARQAFAGRLDPQLSTTTKLVVALGMSVRFVEMEGDAINITDERVAENSVATLRQHVLEYGAADRFGNRLMLTRLGGSVIVLTAATNELLEATFLTDMEISESRAVELLEML